MRYVRLTAVPVLRLALLVVGVFFVCAVGPVAYASPLFPNLPWEFNDAWKRQDEILTQPGGPARSWTWGPQLLVSRPEPYTGATDGVAGGDKRIVEYFDKARMEISDIGHPHVTTGLLVVEMASGAMQTGDTQFTQRQPAQVPVAGDGNDTHSPTYASFSTVATTPNHPYAVPSAPGVVITQKIDRAGTVTSVTPPVSVATSMYDYTTHHNIAQPFVTFMFQQGIVENIDGKTVIAPVYTSDPLHTIFGLPITEPYWIRATVGGVPKDVLVQFFERRVLTYTPTNSDPWKVEMGNVGRQYYMWRYGGFTTVAGTILYDNACSLYLANTDGSNSRRILRGTDATGCYKGVGLSPDGTKIAFSISYQTGFEQYDFYAGTVNRNGSDYEVVHFNSRIMFGLNWSPDNRYITIAWGQTEPGSTSILDSATSTILPMASLKSSPPLNVYAWTSDGTHVLYQSSTDYQSCQLYYAERGHDGAGAQRITNFESDGPTCTTSAQIAPDGNNYAYYGSSKLLVRAMPGGTRSLDGLNVFNLPDVAFVLGWSADGSALICTNNGQGFSVDLHTQAVTYFTNGMKYVRGWSAH